MLDFRKELEKEIQRIIDIIFKKFSEEIDSFRDYMMGIENKFKEIHSDIEDIEDRVNDLEHEMENKVEGSTFDSRFDDVEERLEALYNPESGPIEDKPLPTKAEKEIIIKLNEILKQIKV